MPPDAGIYDFLLSAVDEPPAKGLSTVIPGLTLASTSLNLSNQA
jgi:hypothetical protein